MKEPTPSGGWLGPGTHGWVDLKERDLPSYMRPSPDGSGVRGGLPIPPEERRWRPKVKPEEQQ